MATIGEQFKAAREAKGISEAEAGKATKTLTKVICAMEADDFSGMAAPTYAKGFIRLYAEFLGLDSEPLVEQYMQEHAGAPPRLVDENSQLQQNTAPSRGMPGIPTVGKISAPEWLGPLGKKVSERLKTLPVGPLKDIRAVAGIIAAILVLIALISSVSTCVRRNASEEAAPHAAAPARMLLDEPLPDLYFTEPGKIESN